MSTISVALLIVFLVALLNPELADRIRGRVQGAAGTAGSSPTGKILVGALGAFAPDMTILSGFVSDIVNVQFRHSVLSFTAILAVVLNRLIFGKDAGAVIAAAATAATAAATGTAPGAGAAVPTVLGTMGAAPPPGGTAAAVSQTAAAAAAAAAPTAPLKIGHTGSVRGPPGPPGTAFTATGSAGLPAAAVRTGGKRSKQTGGALPQFFVDNYNPCAIRGLAFLDTSKSPMGMVALMTIFTTVFWDMWINNKRTTGEIVGVSFFGLIVLVMNYASYTIFDCYGANSAERLMSTFKAFVWGAVVGSIAFLIMQYSTNGSQYLPTDASSASLSPSSSGKTMLGPGGTQACPPGQISVNGLCTPAANATGPAACSAPNDDDQFVCDAFKNGKLVSSTVSS